MDLAPANRTSTEYLDINVVLRYSHPALSSSRSCPRLYRLDDGWHLKKYPPHRLDSNQNPALGVCKQ